MICRMTGVDISILMGNLMLPSGFSGLCLRPWTLITYMFVHWELVHLISNMLWLYLFGKACGSRRMSRNMLWIYLCGGISGGIFFMAVYAFSCDIYGPPALTGASAAVIAVAVAATIRNPDYRVDLLILGRVPLRWIAVVAALFFVIDGTGAFAGTDMAHIGGLFAGAVYCLLPQPRRKLMPGHDDNAELDRILAKVRNNGYSSLKPNERNRLFELSKKNQMTDA